LIELQELLRSAAVRNWRIATSSSGWISHLLRDSVVRDGEGSDGKNDS
jgi:hypothetical protein